MKRVLRFRTVPAAAPPRAAAVYAPDEYSLLVSRADGTADRRISIETLTLSFRSVDNALVGLDAYTNWTIWKRAELDPPVGDPALLLCEEPFDVHGIAPGADAQVRYTYSEAQHCLRLIVSDVPTVAYARSLSCLTAGLGPEGELIELWIHDLQIRMETGVIG
jgi:hypothetical protein